ncbi:NAD(P)-dependent oxidoreductase [Fulvivirgaceae bacterium PWU4]|uniref:UDP-glucose 4-epimerase n=1 Tax=Chryseosolibacter histidini TaxID=2782349 RepID=A0AAP2DQ86_9BACT|nr:NAD(P)-dependent oxidoreductase [Chryseosolibacter histidini]MBT1700516.1 NAD(P)-dependent oxidoreductase [Chryseosolibacter histidini]
MVIVTGGLGFIGNELVRQLKSSGEEVVILDNKNRIAPHIQDIQNVSLAEIDITDHAMVTAFFREVKPSAVFHMAAIHYIPECNDNPERTLRVNAEGTQSILRAAAAAGVNKVVFASSGAVYADSAGLLSESTPIAPVDIYGWSKLFGEQLCQLNHSLNGTTTVIARLFNNYGPRETNPHIIPEILRQLQSTSQLQLGNISTVRDYIHTRDCAQALIRLWKSCNSGVSTVNVATGKGFTVHEIINMIGKIAGRTIDVKFDNTRVRRFDKQTQVASIDTLKQLTGWTPQVNIEEGLTDLLRFEKLI